MLFEHRPEMGVDGVKLLVRGEAVDGRLGDAGELLALQPPYPLHEELVEVRGEDRQESDAFQEWKRFVLGEFQDAMIEIQPACFAIEILGGFQQHRGEFSGGSGEAGAGGLWRFSHVYLYIVMNFRWPERQLTNKFNYMQTKTDHPGRFKRRRG